jgi:hypothetical protein
MKLTIGLKLSVLTCLIVIFVGTAISLYFTFIARRYLFQTFEMQSRGVAEVLSKRANYSAEKSMSKAPRAADRRLPCEYLAIPSSATSPAVTHFHNQGAIC